MLTLFLASLASSAAHAAAPNLILITLDGVRYHEVFDGIRKPVRAGERRGTPILPETARVVNEGGFFFGNAKDGEAPMWISNRAGLSQPGYRAILTGQFEKKCKENDCPVIDRETILDRLLDEGAAPRSVAAFSSWDVIDKCIESKTPRAIRSVAFDPIKGLTPEEAVPYDRIRSRALADRPPWIGSRFDKYTFEMGLRYLKEYRPRFLYLAFIEPDEYAHLDDYRGYVASLRDFDRRFAALVATLREMGEYGEETSIVVSTDHGRGKGFLWKSHGTFPFDARRVWAIVLPSEASRKRRAWHRAAREDFAQVDLRPTVELLLGLAPRPTTKGRGLPMIE